MMFKSHHRALRRLSFWLACALLLATLTMGCSDDDAPTGPGPGATGSWQDLGLSSYFVEVDALTSWNGYLVAAGVFHSTLGYPSVNLAAWDGATWIPLMGSKFGGFLHALATFNGDLIVGSDTASNDSTYSIARWNGTQWSALGSGLSGSVWAMAVYGGDLIAGGPTTYLGPDSYVSRWDGSSWHSLGSFDGYVSTLHVYQGLLIASGSFDTVDGLTVHGVAAWNGTSWSALGSGLTDGSGAGRGGALTTMGDTLFAAGGFTQSGGIPLHHVARWNGASWSSVGNLLGDSTQYVSALVAYGDKLVAGGRFPGAVKSWNGSEWVPMSSLNGFVFALTIYNADLIAGGYFPASATQSANGIAKWVP